MSHQKSNQVYYDEFYLGHLTIQLYLFSSAEFVFVKASLVLVCNLLAVGKFLYI